MKYEWMLFDSPSRLVIYGDSGSCIETATQEHDVIFAALDKGDTVFRGVENDFSYIIKNSEATLTG